MIRGSVRSLDFRVLEARDEAFGAALAREVFAAWSRDPAHSFASMVRGPGAVAELAVLGQRERVGYFIVSVRKLGRPFGPIAIPITAHLDSIAVMPRWSRRGVGTLLLQRAEERARAAGAVVLTLSTAISNDAAQNLFEMNGFMRTHRSPATYANGEDAFEMFKPLL